MTRPAPDPSALNSGLQGWDAFVTDLFDAVVTNPFPVAEYANFASLPASGSYDRCLAVTVDTEKIYISKGGAWVELASASTAETYGQIYISEGVGSQTSGGTPDTFAKVTQLTTSGLASGMTADGASSKITLTQAGIYQVSFQCSFTGTTNSVVSLAAYWNSVRQDSVRVDRKLGTGSDVGSCSATGIIDASSASQDLELWFATDGATQDFDLKFGQLTARFMGAT